ncbi:hypothetical protein BAG01nite_49430 [Brevibacillus agri]|uniref:Uncharacterized protein n=1 Tax=Brevibacillus agri TaxID=51101 RepID=A0ABQ0SYB1_9BACL|nr:hypothetical protein BAG01nite_49430 [Brevibacillus agri]
MLNNQESFEKDSETSNIFEEFQDNMKTAKMTEQLTIVIN